MRGLSFIYFGAITVKPRTTVRILGGHKPISARNILSIAIGAVFLGIMSSFLLGCGLTNNSPSGSTTPQGSSGSQGSGGSSGSGSPPGSSFTISVSPATVILAAGGSPQTFQVLATPVDGFKGTINIALGSLPNGVTATPTNLALTPGNPQVIHLAAAQNATANAMTVSLSATSGSVNLTATLDLGITQGAGDASSVPIPASFQPLTGCTNPNTGSSYNDWGVGTSPVYADPVSLNVGKPIYTSNSIFWISRETGPGQSVLMTGAFTDATKTARVALIPPGTKDWQSLVKASTTVVPTTEQNAIGLSFIVPSNFSNGVYGFEIQIPRLRLSWVWQMYLR